MRSILAIVLSSALFCSQAFAAPQSNDSVNPNVAKFFQLVEHVHQNAETQAEAEEIVLQNIDVVRDFRSAYGNNSDALLSDLQGKGLVSRATVQDIKNTIEEKDLQAKQKAVTDKELAQATAMQMQAMGGFGNAYDAGDAVVTIWLMYYVFFPVISIFLLIAAI